MERRRAAPATTRRREQKGCRARPPLPLRPHHNPLLLERARYWRSGIPSQHTHNNPLSWPAGPISLSKKSLSTTPSSSPGRARARRRHKTSPLFPRAPRAPPAPDGAEHAGGHAGGAGAGRAARGAARAGARCVSANRLELSLLSSPAAPLVPTLRRAPLSWPRAVRTRATPRAESTSASERGRGPRVRSRKRGALLSQRRWMLVGEETEEGALARPLFLPARPLSSPRLQSHSRHRAL